MSIDEDRKLLEAVKSYVPPAELHPIAMKAWYLYEDHENSLPPEAIQSLRQILGGYGNDLKALGEAIFGLARFIVYVGDQLGDKASAEKVADLIREFGHLYEPFWEAVGEAMRNVGAEASSVFQSFEGAAAKKTAPAVGEKAPKGSVPMHALAPPPGRPPPWAKKK